MNEFILETLDKYLAAWKAEAERENCPDWKRTQIEKQVIFFLDKIRPIILAQSNLALYSCTADFLRVIEKAQKNGCDTLLYVINVNPYERETKAVGVYSPQQEYGRNITIGAWATDVHGADVYIKNIDLTASDEVFKIERRYENATNY